jgi:hypothetical protein
LLSNFDADTADEVLVGGRETSGLARGPVHQAFDASGSLVRTQFVLNPDFTADNSRITTNLDGVAGDGDAGGTRTGIYYLLDLY